LLLLVEAGVVAVEGQQLVVAAQFDDSAAVEHGDLVGIAHGGDAVGDEDGGGGGGVAAQAAEDALFGVGVDAGQRVVEDEDGGAAQQGAGDGARCFCPPESVTPRSPTMVSKPCGNSSNSWRMCAASAA
jgi:hypothetical protein